MGPKSGRWWLESTGMLLTLVPHLLDPHSASFPGSHYLHSYPQKQPPQVHIDRVINTALIQAKYVIEISYNNRISVKLM